MTRRLLPPARLAALALAALVAVVALAPAPARAQAPADSPSASVVALRLVADADRLVAGAPFRLAVVADVKPGWHVNSHTPKEDYLIPTEVSLPPVAGLAFEAPVYPAHVELKLPFSETPLAVYEGKTVIRVAGKVDPAAAPGPRTLKALLDFQPCNDQQCLAPAQVEATLTIDVAAKGSAASPANAELFGASTGGGAPAAAPTAPAGTASATTAPLEGVRGTAPAEPSPFAGRSLPALLGLVFLAGLALNLTPCVYPLIPITVGFFGRQAAGKTSRNLGLAVLYVLGMSVTYSALGVFAALSGALFGSWLQKPAVLVGIAIVVLALALSMFGLFEIRMPHALTDRTGLKGGAVGAFTMGLFVGFVAAPCIGPFVLSLLTYVAAQGSAVLGFGLFFTLAMGLGVPYLVLGTVTGSLSKLPRSGEWMVAVRKVFGFVLVSLAVYFLRPLLPPRAFDLGLALPLVLGGLYLLFLEKNARDVAWFKPVRAVVSLALVAAGIWLAVPRTAVAGLPFETYSDEALAKAAAEGKPVMIDFFADWCLPCKELEHNTFSDPRVVAAAKGWVLLKADLTREGTEEVARLRQRWGIKGVPTVVFLGPDGKERGPRVVEFERPEAFLPRLK